MFNQYEYYNLQGITYNTIKCPLNNYIKVGTNNKKNNMNRTVNKTFI